jgi:competence protein ComEC
MLFYFGAVSLSAGLAISLLRDLSIMSFLSFASILFGIFIIIFEIFYPKVINNEIFTRFSIIFGIFVIALVYGSIYEFFHQPSDVLYDKVGEKITFEGIVIEEPIPKAKSTHVVVKAEYGKILLFADSHPILKYGDQIKVSGKLKLPEKFMGDSGRLFDYPGFLSKDNIFFIVSYPKIEKLSEGNSSFFKTTLFNFKDSIIKNMEKTVPYPESTLLQGITLAGKKALPSNIEEEFRRAGVSHIVVLSGFNVTIVALIIMKILSCLPRNIAFGASTLGIAVFCIMAGASSTIIRAGIMSFLFLFSKFMRRDVDGNRLLIIAGICMCLTNPRILLYDLSFHLSFLATFGLINLSPFFEKKLIFIPDSLALREIIASSVAVELFLLPYLAYSMGHVSVMALISNILLLPYIPLTMLFGFLAGGLTFIHLKIGAVAGFLSYVLLRYELDIISLMSSFSFAMAKTPVSVWLPIFFYTATLCIFLMLLYFREQKMGISSFVLQQLSNSSFRKKHRHISFFRKEEHRAYMNAPTYRDRE